jgi:hypothetical protein
MEKPSPEMTNPDSSVLDMLPIRELNGPTSSTSMTVSSSNSGDALLVIAAIASSADT